MVTLERAGQLLIGGAWRAGEGEAAFDVFEPATGEATLCGLAVETDPRTGLAVHVGPLRLGGRLSQAEPDFWND